jgi:hypothetical protein
MARQHRPPGGGRAQAAGVGVRRAARRAVDTLLCPSPWCPASFDGRAFLTLAHDLSAHRPRACDRRHRPPLVCRSADPASSAHSPRSLSAIGRVRVAVLVGSAKEIPPAASTSATEAHRHQISPPFGPCCSPTW